MSHLSDGVLRRMQDEPATTSAADSAHFESCPDCRARADAIRAEAAAASSLLAVPEPQVEPEVALLRLRRLAAEQPAGRGYGWFARLRRRRGFRPAAAGVLALGLAVTVMATGVADNFVQQFEPKTFVPVNVNPQSLGSLPDLSQFGTYTISQEPKFNHATSPADAAAASGLAGVLAPQGALPASVTGSPQYEAFTQLQGSFTIDAAKARAYEQSIGKQLPAMPSGMDGTTVSLTAGPGVLTIYGAPDLAAGDSPAGDIPAAGSSTAPRVAPRRNAETGFAIPSLAIVQMTTPKVVSDGASVQALENYLSSLPGVPSDLAAQIQAIGDPASTLPVPVPTGQGSHQVDVNGTSGLFVGDSTGLGAGVIWQKDGILYAVVGTLSEGDVVSIAKSLR